MRPEDAMIDAGAAIDDLEQRVAFATIRGRLFGELGQPVSIGRFLVTRRLGQGGMGVVYAAYDPQLDRKVAVKVMRDVGDDAHAASARRGLEREARAAAGLSHPNVVTVYDSGAAGSGFYVAMELVEGSTLRKWLETPRRWPEIVRMFIAAGRGLQAAHEAGLIHCDFKPDNVLVGGDGRPRVVDFGLVRSMRRVVASEGSPGPTAPHTIMAASGGTGTVMGGTPAYMPPEQSEGQAEARSDQYAFCVALYWALFGEHPYGRGHRLGHAHGRTRVPRAVVRAVVKGLAREVQARHGSMQALNDQLQRVLRRRARLPGLAAAVVLAGGAAGAAYASGATVDLCEEGAAAEIEGVWTPEVRDAVRTSLAAAGDPGQAQALAQRLDEYAHEWSVMQQESCEATHVSGVQSGELLELRTACLARRRNTFAHVVERLLGLSLGQGEAGRQLVEGLQPVGDCLADVLRLQVAVRGQTQSHTDRSRGPETEAAFAEITALLARARSEEQLGTRTDALALIAQAEERAQAMGLRYLEAEAALMRVSLEIEAGRVSEAEADLSRTLALAVEADDSDVAAQTVARLLSLERLGSQPLADRSRLASLGRAWALRTRRMATLRAWIEFEEATHAANQRDQATALALIDGALGALAEEGLAEDTVALKLRTLEGIVLLDAGRLAEAERKLAELLMVQRARLPQQHLDLGDTTFYLANVLVGLGKLEPALPLGHAMLAMSIATRAYGSEHPITSVCATTLGKVVLDRGELELARTLLTNARAHADGMIDPTLPAAVTHQLARLALRATPPDPAAAVALTDEALVYLRRVPGEDAARLTRAISAWRELEGPRTE
jgi:eukaryotic-like serine/threonine-protein kinase